MLLETKDMDVYYGTVQALQGVSFRVDAGEIVTLIGANGAGKSTSLRAISGLVRATNGQILFKGQDISRVPAYKLASMGISHALEGHQVFPLLTVKENLLMGAYIERDQKKIDLAVERVSAIFPRLTERMKQLAGTLSGGEQQMLSMGRALMSSPDLLLLDEPSFGLAPFLVQQIYEIIQEINGGGVSILLVEQNAVMALAVADRGYVLETGRVVLEGTAAELRDSARVRTAYLGE